MWYGTLPTVGYTGLWPLQKSVCSKKTSPSYIEVIVFRHKHRVLTSEDNASKSIGS